MAGKSREDSFADFFKSATGGFTPYRWQMQVAIDHGTALDDRGTTSSPCEPSRACL